MTLKSLMDFVRGKTATKPDHILVNMDKLPPEAKELFLKLLDEWEKRVEGDGKAEFLGEGTEADFEEQELKDKGFTAKPFGL